MYEKLIELVTSSVKIAATDPEIICQYFEPIHASKGTVLEKEQTIPSYLYFIVTGIVRQYKLTETGDEVTTHLNCPPGFITSYNHFSAQTVSDENTACITNCELLRISHSNMQDAINKYDFFKQFSRQILTASLIYNEQRTLELTTLTAAERYRKLLRTQPELVKYVPVQHLASFLGIHPESLSRIRRQITS